MTYVGTLHSITIYIPSAAKFTRDRICGHSKHNYLMNTTICSFWDKAEFYESFSAMYSAQQNVIEGKTKIIDFSNQTKKCMFFTIVGCALHVGYQMF